MRKINIVKMHGMIKTKEPRLPKTASNEFPSRVYWYFML